MGDLEKEELMVLGDLAASGIPAPLSSLNSKQTISTVVGSV